jgi:hypothetical protein
MGTSQSTVEILLQARNNAQQAFAEFSKQIVDITSNVLKSAEASGALADAHQKLGDSTKYTVDAQGKLHDELGRFVSRAQETTTATQASADAVRGWGDIFSSVLHSFEGRVVEAFAIRDAMRALQDVAKEALAAFPEMVEHTIEVGNQLWEMSIKTGASVEGLSALRFVAGQTSVGFETMVGSISKLEQGLGSTGPKAEKLQGTFERLGLDMLTLKNERPDEAFIDVLAALEEVPNRADQAALGMQIFGAKFKGMAALAQEDIGELIDKARELGLVMSTDTAAAAHAAEVGFKALHAQWEAVTMHLSAAFLPALVGVTSTLGGIFNEAIHEANKSLDEMGKPGGFIRTVSDAMGTGNKAIAAQVELYDMLRDALVGVARYGVEPVITSFGFLMTETHAAKVVFGDLMQIVQGNALAFEYLALGIAKFGETTSFGDAAKRYAGDVQRINENIDSLLISMKKRGDSLQTDTKAEQDWGEWAKKATNEVEEAVHQLATSHSDAAETIRKYAEMSHAARGQEVDDLDLVTKGSKEHAKAAEADQQALTKLWDDAATAWAKAGEKGLASRLAALDAQQQREEDHVQTSIRLAEDREEAILAIQNKYDGLRAQAEEQQREKDQRDLEAFEKAAYLRRLDIDKQFRRDLDAQTKDTNTHVIDGLKSIQVASKQLADIEMQQSMTSTQYQIAKIQEWKDAQIRAFNGTKEQAVIYYDLIEREAEDKTQAIIRKNDPVAQAWLHLNDDMRQQWASTWEKALAGQGSFVDALTSPWTEMQNRWKKVIAAMAAAWEEDLLAKLGVNVPGVGSGGGPSGGSANGGGWMSILSQYFGQRSGGSGYSSTGAFNESGEWVPSSEGNSDSGGSTWGMGSQGYGYATMGTQAALSFVPDQSDDEPMTAGGGAIKGAKMGADIAGPYGAAVGAAIGAIVGAFKDHRAKDELNTIAQDWGVTITGKLALAMQDEIDKGTFKTEMAAAVGHLGDIINQAGGLKADNLAMFTGKLHDTFSMIETHQMTVAQGTKVLDDNWHAFVQAGTDGDGRLASSLKDIIKLNDVFGTQSQQIKQYLMQQGDAASTGFNAVVGGMLAVNGQLGVYDKLKKDVDAATTSGRGLADAIGAQKAAALQASGSLADLGIQAVAAFAASVAAGTDEATALRNLHPALQKIEQAYADLGLNIDDAALAQLALRDKIMSAAPELISAVGGLNQEMIALDNMGAMNVTTFGAMERTGAAMYDRLKDEVHELGGTDADALGQMQSFLHQAAKEAELLGTPLDDNTQSLIDQSKKLGIWKDAGKDATDKLLGGVQSLVDKMGELIDRMNGVTHAVNDIPTHKDITIDTHYHHDDPPNDGTNYAARGGFVTPFGVQYLDVGGIAGGPRGTDTVPAWLTPGESVLTRDATAYLGVDTIRGLNRGGRVQSGPDVSGTLTRLHATMASIDRTLKDLPTDTARQVRDVMRMNG